MEVGNSNTDIWPSSMLMNGWNPTKKFHVKEFFWQDDKLTDFFCKIDFSKNFKGLYPHSNISLQFIPNSNCWQLVLESGTNLLKMMIGNWRLH